MSLLMLIRPSDASHFIKGLTFACNSQTRGSYPRLILYTRDERTWRWLRAADLITTELKKLVDLFWS